MPTMGHQAQELFAFESTFRDETGRTMIKMPLDASGASIDMMREQLKNSEIRSSMSGAAPVPSNQTVNGQLRPTFHFSTVGYWLKAAIGAVSSKAAGTIDTPVEVVKTGTATLAKSGTYSGTGLARYEFIIDLNGTPDEFKWRKVTINHFGAETNGSWTEHVAITAGAQVIAEGLSVTFSSTTAAALDDAWSVMCYGQNYHVFTRGTLPTFQLEEGYTDVGEYHPADGCIASRLGMTFSGARPGVLGFDVNVVGAAYRDIAAATQATAVTTPTDVAKALFHLGGVWIGGAESTEKIEELTITIDNGQEGVYEIQDPDHMGTLGVNQEGDPQVSGQLTMAYNDKTLREIAQAETETSIMTAVVSGLYWLRVKLPEIQLQDVKQKITGRGIVKHTIPFIAHYTNSTEASDIYAVLFGGPASL